jgi:hypothetical protein
MMWLGWRDNSDNEAGFEITDGDHLYTTPAGSVDFELDVGYGAYKCFQVRAVNQYGASEWTPFTCESTEAAPAQVQLGGLDDLDGYCESKYGPNTDAQPSAGNWVCVIQGNVGAFYPVNMDEACRWHYEASNVWARQTTAGNPYTWACYSGPR